MMLPRLVEDTIWIWGMALTNPGSEDARVMLTLYTMDGQLFDRVDLVLGPGEKSVATLDGSPVR